MIGKTNIGSSVKPIYDAILALDVTPEKKTVGAVVATISEQLVSKQKAIDAINATKTVSNGYTCESNGMIVASVRAEVTNHDNSWEGTASYAIYKNGKPVKSGGFHIDGWGGGSGGVSTSFVVEKGDTVSYGGSVASDAYIGLSVTGSLSFTPNPF